MCKSLVILYKTVILYPCCFIFIKFSFEIKHDGRNGDPPRFQRSHITKFDIGQNLIINNKNNNYTPRHTTLNLPTYI